MRNFKYLVSLMMVLALALMVFGCAKPPEAEQKAAKTAMDAAITAGAGKYAVVDMEAAMKLFDAAEVQMKEKKYEEAKKGYVGAKAGFEKAVGAVEEGKKIVTAEATAALAALEESWQNVKASAKKFEKSMKEQKEDWEADVKFFEEGLKTGKEMLATDPAGTKAKIDELKTVVEKWDADFKEKASAPVPEVKKEKKAKKGKK